MARAALRLLAAACVFAPPRHVTAHWPAEELKEDESGRPLTMSKGACGSWKGLHKGKVGKREAQLMAAVRGAGIEGIEAAQLMAQASFETNTFESLVEAAAADTYGGRGYLRIRGQADYKAYGDMIGMDLVSDPSQASKREIAAKVTVAYWKHRVQPNIAEYEDTQNVTRLVACRYNEDAVCNVLSIRPALAFERYRVVCTSCRA
mmetsp:Transcript_15304/g.43770  ORF Transcript_15304/g.43770 Transcript_15304/m.43770 type:complete len:205 (+) Transcript_15304:35-649(+)